MAVALSKATIQAVLLYWVSSCTNAAELTASAALTEVFNSNDFASVEALFSGPWHHFANAGEDDSIEVPQSERWRLLVIPAIEEGDTLLVLERVVMGAEGCCIRVAERRLLKFSNHNHFVFERWQGPYSFEFSMADRRYLISGIDTGRTEISPYRN